MLPGREHGSDPHSATRPGLDLPIVTCDLVEASAAEEAEDGQHDDDEKNDQ